MNARERQQRRQLFRQHIHHSSRMHINCFRFNSGNRPEHEQAKFDIFCELRRLGHEVITECEFSNEGQGYKYGRADVVDLTDGVIFEVAVTEAEASLAAKEMKYPAVFRQIVHRPKEMV